MAENERKLTVGYQTIDMSVPRKVFRLVDGKLIRLPGDKREPTKLYRIVNDGKETYDVELTEKEEKERRQQQIAWKAEEPQREAEKKRQEDEIAKFRESLKYENRVTAFLDVLGWGDAIDRSVQDAELAQNLGFALNASMQSARLIEDLKTRSGMDRWYGDPQLTQFSDSILLSVPAGAHAEQTLVFHLHAIVNSMLRLGFLVRGGIAEGQLIHNGTVVYGPALLDAYRLECETAKFPRVILSNELANRWGGGTQLQDENGKIIGRIDYWRRDKDGHYFFDFLNPVPGMFTGWDKSSLTGWLGLVRSVIAESIASQSMKLSVVEKYAWFAEYFNEFRDKHDVDAVPRIELSQGPQRA